MGLAVMHNYTISEGGSFCVIFYVFWRIYNFLQKQEFLHEYFYALLGPLCIAGV